MPLTMVAPNEKVSLMRVRGGHAVRRRLADLGLTPGTVLVAFKDDARLALGRGIAHKVQVEPLN